VEDRWNPWTSPLHFLRVGRRVKNFPRGNRFPRERCLTSAPFAIQLLSSPDRRPIAYIGRPRGPPFFLKTPLSTQKTFPRELFPFPPKAPLGSRSPPFFFFQEPSPREEGEPTSRRFASSLPTELLGRCTVSSGNRLLLVRFGLREEIYWRSFRRREELVIASRRGFEKRPPPFTGTSDRRSFNALPSSPSPSSAVSSSFCNQALFSEQQHFLPFPFSQFIHKEFSRSPQSLSILSSPTLT